MNGAIILFLLFAFIVRTGTNPPFYWRFFFAGGNVAEAWDQRHLHLVLKLRMRQEKRDSLQHGTQSGLVVCCFEHGHEPSGFRQMQVVTWKPERCIISVHECGSNSHSWCALNGKDFMICSLSCIMILRMKKSTKWVEHIERGDLICLQHCSRPSGGEDTAWNK